MYCAMQVRNNLLWASCRVSVLILVQDTGIFHGLQQRCQCALDVICIWYGLNPTNKMFISVKLVVFMSFQEISLQIHLVFA